MRPFSFDGVIVACVGMRWWREPVLRGVFGSDGGDGAGDRRGALWKSDAGGNYLRCRYCMSLHGAQMCYLMHSIVN